MTQYKYLDVNKLTDYDFNCINIKKNINTEFYNYYYYDNQLVLKTDWINSEEIKIESWCHQNKINYIKLKNKSESDTNYHFNDYVKNFNIENNDLHGCYDNIHKIIVKGGYELNKLGKGNERYKFNSLSFRYDYQNPKYFLIVNKIIEIEHKTKDDGVFKQNKFLSDKFTHYPNSYKEMCNLIRNGGKFKFAFMPTITCHENSYISYFKLVGIIVEYNDNFKYIKGAPKFVQKYEKKEITKEEYIKEKEIKTNNSNKRIIDILLHE